MTGEFTLIFDLDSPPFQDGKRDQEIARILKDVATLVVDIHDGGAIRDNKGNTVGKWDIYTEGE